MTELYYPSREECTIPVVNHGNGTQADVTGEDDVRLRVIGLAWEDNVDDLLDGDHDYNVALKVFL